MANTADIAVCLDRALSISFYRPAIRSTLSSIFQNAISVNPECIRMAISAFQSHGDQDPIYLRPFTSSLDEFWQMLDGVQTTGDDSNEKKAIVDALQQCLSLDWRPDVVDGRFNDKLVLLITNGPPCNLLEEKCACNSPDLWQLVDALAKKNITLVVLGIEPTVICSDFYCALAKKTGGEYIPFVNAGRALKRVVRQAILGSYTYRQLFVRLDVRSDIELNSLYSYLYSYERAKEMYKYCATMDDIRRLFYRVRSHDVQAEAGEIINEISGPDSGYGASSPPAYTNYSDGPNLELNVGTLPTNTNYIDLWKHPHINIITSSPINNDDGHRSPLLLATHPQLIYGQRYVHPLAIGSDSEIDDEYILGNNHSNVVTPPLSINFNGGWLHPKLNSGTPTPVTDDEGYRTRLPTGASVDINFNQCFSHSFDNHLSFGSDGDTDDEVFGA
ncbi:unnamed protein product [Adineta ricciae]|uniref:VWFA domain-containing protein n=1 Tax=Adineta ricciae TaxID=249248 RepID=A0A815GB43_ADIRI|nr:unnamed protein product [Adineta ricciae]